MEDSWWNTLWGYCSNCRFAGDGWALLYEASGQHSWNAFRAKTSAPEGCDKIWNLYRRVIPSEIKHLKSDWNAIPEPVWRILRHLFSFSSRAYWRENYGSFFASHILIGTPLCWKTALSNIHQEIRGQELNWDRFRKMLLPATGKTPLGHARDLARVRRTSQDFWLGIPCYDLPGRLVGWYILSCSQTDTSHMYLALDQECSMNMAWSALDSDLKSPLIAFTQWDEYLAWSANWYRMTVGSPAPFIALFRQELPIVFQNQKILIWDSRTCCQTMKLIANCPKAHIHKDLPLLPEVQKFRGIPIKSSTVSHPVEAVRLLWASAEPWQSWLSRHLYTASQAQLRAAVCTSGLPITQWNSLLQAVDPCAARQIRPILQEQKEEAASFRFEGKLIQCGPEGWVMSGKNGQTLISDTILHIEQVVRHPVKKTTRYAGYLIHTPSGRRIPFDEDSKILQQNTRRWIEQKLLDHGLNLPRIDSRWAGKLVSLALWHDQPVTILQPSCIGWSRQDNGFLLPTGTILSGLRITLFDEPIHDLPGKIPITTDTTRFSGFTLARLCRNTAENQMRWASLAAMLQPVFAPALESSRHILSTYFCDSRWIPAVREAALVLDAQPVSANRPQKALEHNWPAFCLDLADSPSWYTWAQTENTSGCWLVRPEIKPLLSSLGWARLDKAESDYHPLEEETRNDLARFVSYFLCRMLYYSFQPLLAEADLMQNILNAIAGELEHIGIEAQTVRESSRNIIFPDHDGLEAEALNLLRKVTPIRFFKTNSSFLLLLLDKQRLRLAFQKKLRLPVTEATLRCMWKQAGWAFSETDSHWKIKLHKSQQLPASRKAP